MDERQLKELLNSDPVPPADENARKRALNLALSAYDEAQQEKQKSRQGFGWLARLTGRSNNRSGRRDMKTTKKWTLIAGTATASVALLGVFTYATIDRVVQPYMEPVANALSSAVEQTARADKKDQPDAKERDDRALREARPAPVQEEEEQQQIARSLPESTVAPLAKPAPKAEKAPVARQAPADELSRLRSNKSFEGKAAPRSEDALSDTAVGSGRPAPTEQRAFGMNQAPAPGLSAQPQGRTSGGMAFQDKRKRKLQVESFRSYAPPPGDVVPSHYKDVGRDRFQAVKENPITRVADAPVSTFSSDVDTAAYAFVRRRLNRGVLPQKNAVRIEELVNYFDYAYPLPETREQPFQPTVTVMPSPWKKGNKLVHIGIKGYDIDAGEKPRSNLVFLLDVSGSMNAPDKLPLMVNSLKLLLDTLTADDTVAIVVYAGAAGTVLEPTKVAEKHKILAALDRKSVV